MPPASPPSTLPRTLTGFVGREQEQHEIRRLPGKGRIVTLVGPNGTGKTRLAIRVAERIASRFADGVVFVSLAPVGHADLVISTIARVLLVQEESLRVARESGPAWMIASNVGLLADLANKQQFHDRGRVLVTEAIAEMHRVDDAMQGAFKLLQTLAEVVIDQAEVIHGVRLLAAAHTYLDNAGVQDKTVDATAARARAKVDEERFKPAWGGGKSMTPDEAVSYALNEVAGASPPGT